jgi:hypothetical protein
VKINLRIGLFSRLVIAASPSVSSVLTLAKSSFVVKIIKAPKNHRAAVVLSAGVGSFAMTAQDAVITVQRGLAADVGSFSIAGVAGALTKEAPGEFVLAALHAAFTVSGQDAVLRSARVLVASVGSLALSGQAAILTMRRRLVAATGSFLLSGQAAIPTTQRRVAAAAGSLSVAGIAAGLTKTTPGALVLAAAPGSFTVSGQAAALSSSAASFTPAWRTLQLGAGGQITNIDIMADGTTVIRTDTYGAYLKLGSGSASWGGSSYAAPAWQQLFTVNTMAGMTQADFFVFVDALNMGCFEIAVAPSNTNVAYAIVAGYVWVTQNLQAGANVSWTRLSLTSTYSGNTNGSKERSKFIAIDPNDPDKAVFSVSGGVYYTLNGTGATPTFTATSITQAATPNIIAWDPASSSHLWIGKDGTGVYESTTGPSGAFTLTSGTQTGVYKMVCDKFSQLWLLTVATGISNIYRFKNGVGWTTVAIGATDSWVNIAIDPASASSAANHVVVTSYGGQPNVSSNNGSSWTGAFSNQTVSIPGTEPSWFANANQSSGGIIFLSTLDIEFDGSGNLYNAAGIGVWTTPAPVSASSAVWTSFSLGIEQLIPNRVISPPGGSPVVATWDRAFFLCQNPDIFPTKNLPIDSSNIICDGWAIDYASNDPTFLAGWAGRASNQGCSSTDGGNTFTRWTGFPAATNIGGDIAVSTSLNFVLFPGNGGGQSLQYTLDGGATWAACVGITGVYGSQSGFNALAAERAGASGTFCAVDFSTGDFYKSTNGGANWTKVATFAASGVDGGGADVFESMPGQAGTYFFSGGGSSGTHPHTNRLWKSTNYCSNWSAISNVVEVWAFGFGAPKPGFTPATIYIVGWYNGVFGFYQSSDIGATWTACQLSAGQTTFPMGAVSYPYSLTGDMNVYGRMYTGVNGAGFAYVDTQDACPWVNFSNAKPHQNFTGTVTLTAKHSGLVPVSGVQFSVDGVNIGSAQTGAGPYSVSWVTGGVTTGAHTLKVTATGANGSGSFSIPITTH